MSNQLANHMKSSFTSILRVILALGLILFGFNKFLGFMPLFEMPPAAANFMESIQNTGYVFYVVALLEIVIGLLLLIKKWVPFALILLAPISFNILLFHMFLDISDIWVAIIIVVINILLIYKYWRWYRPMFQA
jgi:putative oxidoreductase